MKKGFIWERRLRIRRKKLHFKETMESSESKQKKGLRLLIAWHHREDDDNDNNA
jgi:hypothetical protein